MFIPLNYTLRSLWVRKSTTFATALGIGLVVFVLASSLMLSRGIEKTLGSSGRPDRAIVIRKGSDNELSSSIEGTAVGIILSAPGVKKAGSTPKGTGEGVIVLALEKLGTEGKMSNIQARGVTPMSQQLRKDFRIIEGRPLTPGTDEALIGVGLVGKFAGMELGKSFDIKKNRPLNVVGIFDTGGSSMDSEAWVDLETLRSSFGRGGTVSSVLVELDSKAAFDGFENAVEHDKQLGLEVMREDAYYEKQSEGTAIFIKAMGIVVAFFFSLGAMIGAMITMYAAVSQRSKEIGTLRALGFARSSILIAFVVESFFLALVGGLLGAIASLAMGFVKLSMMNFNTWQEVTFHFDPDPKILAVSILIGGLMGLFGGFFPAIRAARLSPIQAMRG
jgi:putative ABC transport system permease protein